MDAFINEGLIQNLFAEGSLILAWSILKSFRKDLSLVFDQTDMTRAKQILGDKFCIQGNYLPL